MDNDYIGVKLADGSFFPVIEEFSVVKKRLILTTVRDNQSSMQINLYKGKVSQDFINLENLGTKNLAKDASLLIKGLALENSVESNDPSLTEDVLSDESLFKIADTEATIVEPMTDNATHKNKKIDNIVPSYVGSLIVEDIEPAKKGEPSVSLVLSFDSDNNLSAEAVDLDSGNHQSINVSLTSINQPELYGVPDFDLTDVTDSNVSDTSITGNPPEGLLDSQKVAVKAQKSCRMPCWLSITFFIIGLIALLLALLILFPAYRTLGFNGIIEFITGTNTEQTNLVDSSFDEKIIAEPIIPEYLLPCDILELTPVSEEEPVDLPETVLEAEKTETEESETQDVLVVDEPKKYRIKWGDTLWDIADAHYKNPWKYKDLARFNGIKNPDHIISGTDVLIPPR